MVALWAYIQGTLLHKIKLVALSVWGEIDENLTPTDLCGKISGILLRN